MKELRIKLVFVLLIAIFFTSCTEEAVQTDEKKEDVVKNELPSEEEVRYEEWVTKIDANESLSTGNSLFYSKPTGESIEVAIFVNDENETVKVVERFSTGTTQSISKRIFYLKDGKKFVSKEYLEEAVDGDFQFVERISYYDENEQPIASKTKSAAYEEELDFETYQMIEPFDCKMDRALNVLNQVEDYATTFQGFVKEGDYLYIIVGENDPDGYSSSLVVQYVDKTIMKLQEHEMDLIGKPLIIDFETVADAAEGFEYQILHKVEIR